jgi:trigger factor
LNIQTEQLENQTARFTVELDADQFEKAKQKAARKIGKQVRIPGFRKGKVPYRILVQNGLEGQIVIEAFEDLYPDIYTKALDESGLDTYGPGTFERYELDPPTLIYTVPLHPTVDLGDYKSVRIDYTAPEVADEEVDKSLKNMQHQHAVVEESSTPIALNNRVTIDIDGKFLDDPQEVEETEDEDGEEKLELPKKGDSFAHIHEAAMTLDPELAPVLAGFSEALVGANLGDTVVFELTIPEDDEDYKEINGRAVEFTVDVQKIENVTLPTLNDDLAALVTAEEDEPLTLLQLRVRVRENLESAALKQTNEDYSTEVLTKMVECATITYPEIMVEEQIDDMLKDMEDRLQSQNVSKEVYLSTMGKTEEELRQDYHPLAIESLKRTLVLREIVTDNNIQVDEKQVEARIDEVLEQFGEQAEALRSVFDNPEMRFNMINDLVNEKLGEFIVATGKGEEPVIENVVAEEETEAEEVVADDASAEVEAAPEIDETPEATEAAETDAPEEEDHAEDDA